ncbi:cell division protein SepF [Kineosporia sp. J2-2]|uniref:Cell division protein SepF n=1 Tax=Kineosporia corallincola TaxID=2835133 RepID=A0ABS5TJ21_9ACTN|nr:cell division protein SepF [Kineosporia corallincola]MBT0771090.1 cell division protein SepF [Kineosporia corallincola]
MSGALRKTMVYLGLAEDDDRYSAYDEYEDEDFDPVVDDEDEREEPRRAPVTPIGRAQGQGQMARVVAHPSAEIHRITTIHPRTYNEAKTIGESFRSGTPVIMNLTDMDDADAKRLVDFSAGLVFGLHGSIEKVTGKVFLLSPANVEVATPEKPRPAERSAFFNQS